MKIIIDPVAKPRQTRSDKWKQRPCVLKYRAFADELRYKCKLAGIKIDSELDIEFNIPMPKSWSKKKKAEMLWKPHQQKPDIDNLVKALLDSLLPEDSHIWKISASKIWDETGSINFRDEN